MSKLQTLKNFPLNAWGRMIKERGGTVETIRNPKGGKVHYTSEAYANPETYPADRKKAINQQKVYGKVWGWTDKYNKKFTTTMKGHQVEHPQSKYDFHMQEGHAKSEQEQQDMGHDIPSLVITSEKTNVEKGIKSMAEWTPNFNKEWFVKHIEKINLKHEGSVSPESAQVFKSITGRDIKTKVKQPAYKTYLCQDCHTPTK